jgi:hypothetical protein
MNSARNCLSHHTLFLVRHDRQWKGLTHVSADVMVTASCISNYKTVMYMILSDGHILQMHIPMKV